MAREPYRKPKKKEAAAAKKKTKKPRPTKSPEELARIAALKEKLFGSPQAQTAPTSLATDTRLIAKKSPVTGKMVCEMRSAADTCGTNRRKLDPILTFATLEPAQQRIQRQPATPEAPLQLAHAGDFRLNIMSVGGQLTLPERTALTQTDEVPVLIEFTEPVNPAEPAEQDRLPGFADEHGKHVAENIGPRTVYAKIPRVRLPELENIPGIRAVEASVKLRPCCDLAHRSAGLLPAQGVQRSTTQTGRGVLVGIVDSGIDFQHPAFRAADGTSRIVKYIDQRSGNSLTQQQLTAGGLVDPAAAQFADTIGHGTHVAGIAAGNGGGSLQNQWAGVATEADLAIVKTTFDSANIARGVRDLFDLATERGQPCVVNLSLGGHYGGHDGTSVVERAIDQLSGPGRLVVASAGNEGRARVHAMTVLPAGSAAPAQWIANFQVSSRVVDGEIVGLIVLQVWHQREDALTIRIRTPSGEFFTPTLNGVGQMERDSFIIQSDRRIATYSGDHHTTFQIVTVPQTQWLNGWSLVVDEDRANGLTGVQVGAVHSWILDDAMGVFLSGDTQTHLVGMPGTAFSAITVASYATRSAWTSIDPTNVNVQLDAINPEDISYFSSPGPTRDGENKPEIAAPGQWLLAPLSAQALLKEVPNWLRTADVPYAAMQGTSMAAPYITGALALLLQKDPTLDWAEAKRRLIKSARQDGFTKPCWNARWGYGKLDIMRLLNIEPTADA